MKPSEVLRAARGRIHDAERDHICECLAAAAETEGQYVVAIGEIHDVIEQGDGSDSIAAWLRKEPRTVEDARDLFDRAIAAAEARGE